MNKSTAVRNPDEILVHRRPAAEDDQDQARPPEASAAEHNKFLDQVTMKYMMNPQYHKQYLAKTNYSKYQEVQAKTQHVDVYQDEIQHIVKELLADFIVNGNFTKYTTDLNQSFEHFMNTCVAYLDEHAADHQEVEVLFAEPKRTRGGARVPRI